ncbi:hypothetical protein [Microcystis aeruginosa]|nr:hypothetical protein [Microcystis aeruginosa]
MLEPEPSRKPIAPILPHTRLERTNQLSLLPDKDLGRTHRFLGCVSLKT